MRQVIIGTWNVEISNVAGVVTLRPDGVFSGYWSNMVRPKGWRFEGQWDISNGIVFTKWTNANFWNYTNDFVLGAQKSWKILQLDRKTLGVWDKRRGRNMDSKKLRPNQQHSADESRPLHPFR